MIRARLGISALLLLLAAPFAAADGLYHVGGESQETIPLKWVEGLDATYGDNVVLDSYFEETGSSEVGGDFPLINPDRDATAFCNGCPITAGAPPVSAVPEPSSLVLVFGGGALLLRRRR